MKESYRKGLASHPDPESCEGDGNVALEALTGAYAGFVLSSEIEHSRVPTASRCSEGNTAVDDMRVHGRPCGVEDQSMYRNSMCENRETLLPPESESGRAGWRRR